MREIVGYSRLTSISSKRNTHTLAVLHKIMSLKRPAFMSVWSEPNNNWGRFWTTRQEISYTMDNLNKFGFKLLAGPHKVATDTPIRTEHYYSFLCPATECHMVWVIWICHVM